MNRFAALFTALDQTTSTNARVAALADYFRQAPEDDRLWTVALLSGRRPRRAVTATNLREWAAGRAGIPLWLFEEAYPVVGDLAETLPPDCLEPTSAFDRVVWNFPCVVRDGKGEVLVGAGTGADARGGAEIEHNRALIARYCEGAGKVLAVIQAPPAFFHTFEM